MNHYYDNDEKLGINLIEAFGWVTAKGLLAQLKIEEDFRGSGDTVCITEDLEGIPMVSHCFHVKRLEIRD